MAAPSSRRVVIVGGGIAGLSVAHFLGRIPGFHVTLIEREPRHNAHSSGRSAEIQRVAVPDPIAGSLATETADAYRNPEAVGLPGALDLVERTGLFVLSDEPEVPWHAELLASGRMAASSIEELQKRAPHFRGADRRVTWFEDAGRVRAARLVAALSRSAMKSGVRFLRSGGDASLEVSGGRIKGALTAPFGRLEADDVVIAAGAWSKALGDSVGAPATLRRTSRHIVEFERLGKVDQSSLLPPVVWDDTEGFYVRIAADRIAVSPCDTVDIPAIPDPRAYRTDPTTVTAARRSLEACSSDPSSIGPVLRTWTGYRDLTPDDRPILGADGRVHGLHWCAGLGGHGMTLGLAAGRAAALSISGQPPESAVHCSVHRFD